jgi:hypothetical protein
MGLGLGRVWISASGQQAGACPWNAGPDGRRLRGRGAAASAPPATLVTGRSHDALGLGTARHSGQAQNWAVARYCSEIDQAFQAACKLVRKFASQHPSLTLSNETGSTGSDRYRGSGNRGYECLVLAPSVIPSKAAKSKRRRLHWRSTHLGAKIVAAFGRVLRRAVPANPSEVFSRTVTDG